ncbi:VOC family protein [Devosia sp.]|uniref:VOC family protein n=1 Tax=Devosia sp. TaxID=1871048 RepID=UPI003A8C8E91
MNRNITHGAPSWFEYVGPNPAEARKFYTDVLDWSVADMPMADGSSYGRLEVADEPVGGFSPNPAPRAGWIGYITVDDVDTRFRRAVEHGAKPLVEPFDAPGVGRMCHLTDPSGAAIAFITYAH